jgi:hypothetical protein
MTKYYPDNRQQCPHCRTIVRLEKPSNVNWGQYFGDISSPKYNFRITFAQCPQCLKIIITKEKLVSIGGSVISKEEEIIWPFSSTRDSIPIEVPDAIGKDYLEAALVLPFSPKASAALSRRCLQTILREAGHTTKKDLANQIDEVLPVLPTMISENLDAVRVIGNFAAHTQKSTTTGEIVDVEPGEAEWNLEVIDALFDFYYVRPILEKKKRDDINKKLADAGKPPLKTL